MKPALSVTFCLIMCLCGSTLAQAPAPTQRIRGDVVAVDSVQLQVRSRSGETLAVKLADNFAVTAVITTERSAIRPGAFVGVATMPQADGTLSALEVLVFPEAMRGSGEGHYAWDLKPGSMMTNATVATVAPTAQAGARQVTLKYRDGEKTIVVPDEAPIVTFEAGDKSLLVPGAHILLTATKQADGSLTAARVLVGKNGLVPPM
jgi:hypothetical protein